MTSGLDIEPPAIVGFIDQDYRYKSVDTQIPHEVWQAPSRDRTWDRCVRGSDSMWNLLEVNVIYYS